MVMQKDTVVIWYGAEGDCLYVSLCDGDGDMVRTQDGKALVKVDDDGNVIGFQIYGVSKRGEKPFGFSLVPDATALATQTK